MKNVKQFKLKDFDTPTEKSLTLSVARLVSAGWSLRKIAKRLKLRNHQNVAYHRDKAVRQRILKRMPEGWCLAEDIHSSVETASHRCQKKRARGKVSRRLTAKSIARPKSPCVAGRGLDERVDRLSNAPVQRWGKHAVKGVFPLRREPDWGKVRLLAHRVVAVKPEQFVFYDGCVTLTVRSRSVKVDVFGCEGRTAEAVLEQAKDKAKVKLGDFLHDFGGELGAGEFSTSSADWTLNKGLSKLFLAFKPDLADASHPFQVEVSEVEKDRIDKLLDGSLEERFARLEGMFERLLSKFDSPGVESKPDWRDRN